VLREAPRYPVEIVDRIGAGDSFVAGLLHGLLDGDLDLAIRWPPIAARSASRPPAISTSSAPRTSPPSTPTRSAGYCR